MVILKHLMLFGVATDITKFDMYWRQKRNQRKLQTVSMKAQFNKYLKRKAMSTINMKTEIITLKGRDAINGDSLFQIHHNNCALIDISISKMLTVSISICILTVPWLFGLLFLIIGRSVTTISFISTTAAQKELESVAFYTLKLEEMLVD